MDDSKLAWATIFDEAAIGLAIVDAEGRFVRVNSALAQILGTAPMEIARARVVDYAHPDELASDLVLLERLASGALRSTEQAKRLVRRDGRVVHAVARVKAIEVQDGEPPTFLWQVLDVSEQGRLAQALAEARQRLELFSSVGPAVIYSSRASGDFRATYVSENVRHLFGYEPREFLEDASFRTDRIHPDDRLGVERVFASLGDRPESLCEYRFLHRDGSYRWTFDKFRLLRDAGGNPTGIVGFWVDVTDRRQMEERLRVSDASFRALIESTPEAVFVHRAGRTVYVNPAAVASLGYERAEDLLGLASTALVHPDDVQDSLERFREAAAGRTPAMREVRLLKRDGSVRRFEAVTLPIVFDGEPALVCLAHDVTEQRQMQQRLRLAERLASLGTLAAGVAHEINNPLAFVGSNIGVIDKELKKVAFGSADAPTVRKINDALDGVREGAARVAHIVRDLKAFSRSDDDREGPVDIQAVLDLSINMASVEVRHRARLVKDYSPVPPVRANEARLGQVFLNLIINAAQAIREGDVAANEIRVATRAESNERVVVAIRDTGAGIPPEVLPRIFDPFFTTKPMGLGTGLGLSICHGIVTGLGGDITVKSELGRGSEFRVTLPAAPVMSAVLEPAPAAAPGRARILVVDDEAHMVAALVSALGDVHEPEAVLSAREALDRIERGERFDVILCDLMMPGATGMDLHRELSRRVPEQAARMIFMTGGAFTAAAQEFLRTQDAPHLEKPFSEETLLALIHQRLSK